MASIVFAPGWTQFRHPERSDQVVLEGVEPPVLAAFGLSPSHAHPDFGNRRRRPSVGSASSRWFPSLPPCPFCLALHDSAVHRLVTSLFVGVRLRMLVSTRANKARYLAAEPPGINMPSLKLSTQVRKCTPPDSLSPLPTCFQQGFFPFPCLAYMPR